MGRLNRPKLQFAEELLTPRLAHSLKRLFVA
jgi:hypothetical protein